MPKAIRELGLTCGINNCNNPAICGLKNKEHGFVVNVCRDHFIEMIHREPREDEVGLGQLVMELGI